MDVAIVAFAGSKVFREHIEKYTPPDPCFETIEDVHGNVIRRKREIPPGLSTRDAQIMQTVNKRAHKLDRCYEVSGFVFGWSFFISLVPVLGSIVNFTLNQTLILSKVKEAEIPSWLIREMLYNNLVSFVVGLIPIFGCSGVSILKCNSRNAALLDEFLALRGAEYFKNIYDGPQRYTVDIKPGAGLGKNEIPDDFRDA